MPTGFSYWDTSESDSEIVTVIPTGGLLPKVDF